ncbi:hypothetical protein BASA60_003423 [Batrachochytrium salamandrivorans]|nr:hypothetical protein BASA60_003423 [Batrachochytrium salamandrivorans]
MQKEEYTALEVDAISAVHACLQPARRGSATLSFDTTGLTSALRPEPFWRSHRNKKTIGRIASRRNNAILQQKNIRRVNTRGGIAAVVDMAMSRRDIFDAAFASSSAGWCKHGTISTSLQWHEFQEHGVEFVYQMTTRPLLSTSTPGVLRPTLSVLGETRRPRERWATSTTS